MELTVAHPESSPPVAGPLRGPRMPVAGRGGHPGAHGRRGVVAQPGSNALGRLALVASFSGALALGGLAGCERVDHRAEYETPREYAPAVTHPQVDRDLQQLVDSGVIRMITRYNSSNYFIHKGGQAGFDFELFARYARRLGLAVEVVIPGPGEDLISLLNSGRGDVICAGLTRSEQVDLWAAATRPYNFVDKVVVLPADDRRPDTIAALSGLTITITDHSPVRTE